MHHSFLTYIVVSAGFALIAGFIASMKSRNVVGWAICGLFTGLIGIFILIMLDDLGEQRRKMDEILSENRELKHKLQDCEPVNDE